MNKVAPLVLMLLVVVAVMQVLSARGGDQVEADNGIVSDEDLREETTTSRSQRTFVTLEPLPDTSVSVVARRPTIAGPTVSSPASVTTTTSSNSTGPTDGPSTSSSPTTGTTVPTSSDTTEPPSTTGTTDPTVITTEPTPSITVTVSTRPSSTTARPTTTEAPPTTESDDPPDRGDLG